MSWPTGWPAGQALPVPPAGSAVVFDIDGTVLDSAPGIVAGLRHALESVNVEPPQDDQLRRDLGPPLRHLLQGLGVRRHRMETAVAAYRDFYFSRGLAMATPYEGVHEVLPLLRQAGLLLGTATAKRTDVAAAILEQHGLLDYFHVVNGTEDAATDKESTLRDALVRLGRPSAAVMIGDRHFDMTAARSCGCFPLGAGWGYGSVTELVDAGAAVVADAPADLRHLVNVSA
jgi:phosphoglycolate phosphatase